jgi:hypothetical protein
MVHFIPEAWQYAVNLLPWMKEDKSWKICVTWTQIKGQTKS